MNIDNLKAASLASRLVESNRVQRGEEDDDEAIFAELEAEIENSNDSTVREHALAQIQREMEQAKQMRENQHGKYTEIAHEKEVIQTTVSEKYCVVHFYHNKFNRCAIMDKHLTKIAPKYFNTRFIRVFVENVPFLVERLGVKVLPCVICFIGGVSKDRLIGFEELGNSDGFDTATLELHLSMIGVIKRPTRDSMNLVYNISSDSSTFPSSRLRQSTRKDEEEEFDL